MVTEIIEIQTIYVEGMVLYLNHVLSDVKGIGPKTIEKIVDKYKESSLDVIMNCPDLLCEDRLLRKDVLENLKDTDIKVEQNHDLLIYLNGLGITGNTLDKVREKFGITESSVKAIVKNPYILTEISGIGFKTADKIAKKAGVTGNHPGRLKAAIMYILSQALKDGHCYLPLYDCTERINKLLQDIKVTERQVTAQLSSLQEIDKIKLVDNDKIYLPFVYYVEQQTGRLFIKHSNKKSFLQNHLNDLQQFILSSDEFLCTPEQEQALLNIFKYPVSLVVGSAGTGKTTMIKILCKYAEKAGINCRLATPTGKAAKRISEVTGYPAKTIHRLLKITPPRLTSKVLLHDVDILVVDEVSMVDIWVMNALLKALGRKTHLVMIGDHKQLPSVEAGSVLRDLLRAMVVPVTELKTIHRQAKNSEIITLASQIIDENTSRINLRFKRDVHIINVNDKTNLTNVVIDRMKHLLRRGYSIDDIQVLSPLKNGYGGVENLNVTIRETFNPASDKALSLWGYRVNDKVIQTVNNYTIQVMNGEIGKIKKIDFVPEPAIYIEFDDVEGKRLVRYTKSNVKQLEFAYALTVHKYQGSQNRVIILVLHTSHFLFLTKELAYTGISRASDLLYIVGKYKALYISRTRTWNDPRYSGLVDILIKEQNKQIEAKIK